MDTWDAVNRLMLYMNSLDKICYCPLKTNCLVVDSFENEKYKNIKLLKSSNKELEDGKIIKGKRFAANKKVKLSCVIVSTERTDNVATNKLSQISMDITPSCV